MAHDPLCPVVTTECIYDDHVLVGQYDECERCDIGCDCELIAKVRADQDRRNAARELTREGQDMGMIP